MDKSELDENSLEEKKKNIFMRIYNLFVCFFIIFNTCVIFYIIFFWFNFNKVAYYIFLLTSVFFLIFSILKTNLFLFTSKKEPYKRIGYNKDSDIVGVEGIISDQEFMMMDRDLDGDITLLEYFPKTDKEIVSIILEKVKGFRLDEFYKYVEDSYLLIEEGIREKNPELFSGYLNYGYFQLVKNKIIADSYPKRELQRIVGMAIKDAVLKGNILVVKLAITIRYKDSDLNDIYILTYINNLNELKENENKCSNCGSLLKNSGICEYCTTYNYFSYKGFILNDKTMINISGDEFKRG